MQLKIIKLSGIYPFKRISIAAFFIFTFSIFAQTNKSAGAAGKEEISFTSFLLFWILLFLVIVSILSAVYFYSRIKTIKKRKILKGDAAIDELNNAYNNLKKAWQKKKEENEQLRKTIHQLKMSIGELEEANYELMSQKEKLITNQNQLKELQKKKEELFAIAIHDIKNPASAVRGYAELLEDYDLNATEQQEIVQYLLESTSQILSLAQEMNKAVVEEEETVKVKNNDDNGKKVPLYKIIKSVISQNIAYANKKQVQIINNASADTPNVKGIKSKMEEVLFNLINNSIKFSPPGTIVQIKSYFTNKNVTVEIIDNGVGIAKEDIARAFTKGGKLTAKPTGDEQSTGLGLWIVKKIIEDHKGEVWVESKLNVGSTFGFKLPIS